MGIVIPKKCFDSNIFKNKAKTYDFRVLDGVVPFLPLKGTYVALKKNIFTVAYANH